MDRLTEKWSQLAVEMGDFHLKELHEKGKEWEELLIKYLNEGGSKKAVDVGCGTGFIAFILAKMGWDVVAIDNNEAMIIEAKKRADDLGLKDKIKFAVANAWSTGLRNNLYDAVVSRHSSWLFLEPKRAYKEWFKLLRPGGCMLNLDANWLLPIWNNEAAEQFKSDEEKLIKLYGEFKDYYHDTKAIAAFKTLPLVYKKRPQWDLEVLEEIGFCNIEIEILSQNKYWNDFLARRYSVMPTFAVKAEKMENI